MALAFPVTVTGAEVAERALGRVGAAAAAAEKKTQAAGKAGVSFAAGMERLDGAVDAVEKPMRALNGALDIASVALGVGLAGPLGVVIGQFGDFAQAIGTAISQSDLMTTSYDRLGVKIRAVGDAARVSRPLIDELSKASAAAAGGNLTAANRVAAVRAGVAVGGIEGEIETLRRDLERLVAQEAAAQSEIEAARSRAVTTQGALRARLGGAGDGSVRDAALAAQFARRDISNAEGQLLEVRKLIEATTSTLERREVALTRAREQGRREVGLTTEVTLDVINLGTRAAAASTARAAATRDETSSLEGLRKALTAIDPLVKRAGEDTRTARLVAGVESGRVPVTDGLFPSSRSTSDVLSQGADAFGPEPVAQMVAALGEIPPQATAAEASLLSLSAASADLGSLGVAGLQQFSAAAGQALGSLIIGGEGTSKSLKRIAGEVTSSLAISALSYATFLTGLGIAASLSGGVLGFFAPAMFTAAKTMAVTGVALGLTARALGAGSSPGGGGARPSSGGASGGGGDRVGSLSSGRPGGAQPVMVTVVLGVEQVTSVLVDGARREARAGGLSGGRLAVA
jgi:hypothetical protein